MTLKGKSIFSNQTQKQKIYSNSGRVDKRVERRKRRKKNKLQCTTLKKKKKQKVTSKEFGARRIGKKRLTQLITKVTFDIELSQENFQQQKNLKATQKLNCEINKKIKFMTQRKSSICLKGEKKAKRKNRKK